MLYLAASPGVSRALSNAGRRRCRAPAGRGAARARGRREARAARGRGAVGEFTNWGGEGACAGRRGEREGGGVGAGGFFRPSRLPFGLVRVRPLCLSRLPFPAKASRRRVRFANCKLVASSVSAVRRRCVFVFLPGSLFTCWLKSLRESQTAVIGGVSLRTAV